MHRKHRQQPSSGKESSTRMNVLIRPTLHSSRRPAQSTAIVLNLVKRCDAASSSTASAAWKAYRSQSLNKDMNVSYFCPRSMEFERNKKKFQRLVLAILGVIPRKCPKEPLAELFWELKTCNTDHDCWPRVCCPDGIMKYCRTSNPELDTLPVGRQLAYRRCLNDI